MKKAIRIFLAIIFSIAVLLFIVILTLPKFSDEQIFLREIFDSIAYRDDSVNYDELFYEDLYDKINEFLSFDNYQDALEAEYKYAGLENSDECYWYLKSAHAASMFQTHRYDEFKDVLDESKNLSSDELENYYWSVWICGIMLAEETNSIDYIKVGEIIDKIQYSSDDLQERNLLFRYYWNLYWDINMTEDFKNKVINLPEYSTNRSLYVLYLLKADKYEEFNKLFVVDYINYPLDGIDILMLKDDLNKEQLKELDKSLENLKEEFRTKKPKLYEAMEKEKIEILQNSVRKEF